MTLLTIAGCLTVAAPLTWPLWHMADRLQPECLSDLRRRQLDAIVERDRVR